MKYGVSLNLICHQLYSSSDENGEWIEMETLLLAAGSYRCANRFSTASCTIETHIEGFVE